MKVCKIPLYWQEVDCDLYQNKAPAEPKKEKEASGLVPKPVVILVQLFALVNQLITVGTVSLPIYAVLLTVAITDWLVDWVFMGLFGWWCLPCAGVFIWILNIALLPFTVIGWVHRFMLETIVLPIDGWLLLLGGSGCYLRFGHDCWSNKRVKDRTLRHFLDIPWLTTTIGQQNNSSFSSILVR